MITMGPAINFLYGRFEVKHSVPSSQQTNQGMAASGLIAGGFGEVVKIRY
jgi:hypothetical protein